MVREANKSMSCTSLYFRATMTCRVVSDNTSCDKCLKILIYFNGEDLEWNKVSIKSTGAYATDIVKRVVENWLMVHPELNAHPHRYARAIFKYPKFNQKVVSTTDWMKASPNGDMLSLATQIVEQLGRRMVDDFENELKTASMSMFCEYVGENSQVFRNVLETALCKGEIMIYLKSNQYEQRRPGVRAVNGSYVTAWQNKKGKTIDLKNRDTQAFEACRTKPKTLEWRRVVSVSPPKNFNGNK